MRARSRGSIGHGRLLRLGLALLLVVLTAALPAQGREKPLPVKVGDARLLHRGSVFGGPNGLFFGPDDRLYVASVNGGELSVLDPRSGHILETLRDEVDVLSPDDVTVTPDGTVYWTNILNGTVGRLSPDGSSKAQFVGFGVNPITVSDDGRVFVGLAFFGDGLAELDPDLTDPPVWLIGPGPPQPLALNGFDFGPDGKLYAPRMFTGQIVRIDVDAVPLVQEVVFSGLTPPNYAVKFNSKGVLHAVANGDVFRLNLETGAKTLLLDTNGNTDNLAFDSKDRPFVSMLSDNAVLEVLPSGRARLLNPPGVGNPGGLAVLPNGRGGEDVWVGDFYTLDQIDGRTGAFDAHVGPAPTSVNVDATGSRLILSGLFSEGVQVFDPASGAIVATYPAAGTVNAAAYDGDIAIAQLGSPVVVNTTGTVLMSGLILPTGMASDEENLYVSDWVTGVIWRLRDGIQTPFAVGLQNPEGLELGEGELLVVEEGTKQLIAIDLTSGTRSVVAEGLPIGRQHAPSPFGAPYGLVSDVAVGPSGDVYFTADDPNGVYVLRR